MIKEGIYITQSRIIIYFNSDILFHERIAKLIALLANNENFYRRNILIVGKRGDIYWKRISIYKSHDEMWNKSKLHPGCGVDYFIFTRYTFSFNEVKILSKIVVGRVKYDNIILLLKRRDAKCSVIDSTQCLKAIHLSVSSKEKEKIISVYNCHFNNYRCKKIKISFTITKLLMNII